MDKLEEINHIHKIMWEICMPQPHIEITSKWFAWKASDLEIYRFYYKLLNIFYKRDIAEAVDIDDISSYPTKDDWNFITENFLHIILKSLINLIRWRLKTQSFCEYLQSVYFFNEAISNAKFIIFYLNQKKIYIIICLTILGLMLLLYIVSIFRWLIIHHMRKNCHLSEKNKNKNE